MVKINCIHEYLHSMYSSGPCIQKKVFIPPHKVSFDFNFNFPAIFPSLYILHLFIYYKYARKKLIINDVYNLGYT